MKERIISGVSIDGRPVKIFDQDEELPSEAQILAKKEINGKTAHIPIITKQIGNISGARTERRDYASNPQISEEVATNLNFLSHYKGEKAVSEYLNTQQSRTEGPLEAALRETNEKILVLKREKTRIDADIVKYEAALTDLQRAVGIITGKIQVNGTAVAPKARMGEVRTVIKEILVASPGILKSELLDQLELRGQVRKVADQNVRNAQNKGCVEVREGNCFWVEQQQGE